MQSQCSYKYIVLVKANVVIVIGNDEAMINL